MMSDRKSALCATACGIGTAAHHSNFSHSDHEDWRKLTSEALWKCVADVPVMLDFRGAQRAEKKMLLQLL
jgi:hypothetical protein